MSLSSFLTCFLRFICSCFTLPTSTLWISVKIIFSHLFFEVVRLLVVFYLLCSKLQWECFQHLSQLLDSLWLFCVFWCQLLHWLQVLIFCFFPHRQRLFQEFLSWRYLIRKSVAWWHYLDFLLKLSPVWTVLPNLRPLFVD